MNTDGIVSLLPFLLLPAIVICHGDHGDAEQLFKWSTIDYDWPTKAKKDEAIRTVHFVPLKNAIHGLRVNGNRIFVTVPRLSSGVPSTLNTIVRANSRKPFLSSQTVLRPFPNWKMQEEGNCTTFQKVQNIEIDPKKNRMFVIDTGGRRPSKCPAKLVIYDLKTDKELHRHVFAQSDVNMETNYLNGLVMDYNNTDSVKYLYITDTADYTIVVYDIDKDKSYTFKDKSMQPEPNKIDANTSDNAKEGVNGIAISANFKYVYYSSIAGTGLYQIPTHVLRNQNANFSAHVRKVGDKPSHGEGMIMSTKNSLYFSVQSKPAVAMWEIDKDAKKYGSEGKVKMDSLTYEENDPKMKWVDSLALDSFGYLWFTTSNLRRALDNGMKNDTINFIIWRAFVHEPSYSYFRYPTYSGTHNNSVPCVQGDFLLTVFALFSFVILSRRDST